MRVCICVCVRACFICVWTGLTWRGERLTRKESGDGGTQKKPEMNQRYRWRSASDVQSAEIKTLREDEKALTETRAKRTRSQITSVWVLAKTSMIRVSRSEQYFHWPSLKTPSQGEAFLNLSPFVTWQQPAIVSYCLPRETGGEPTSMTSICGRGKSKLWKEPSQTNLLCVWIIRLASTARCIQARQFGDN